MNEAFAARFAHALGSPSGGAGERSETERANIGLSRIETFAESTVLSF